MHWYLLAGRERPYIRAELVDRDDADDWAGAKDTICSAVELLRFRRGRDALSAWGARDDSVFEDHMAALIREADEQEARWAALSPEKRRAHLHAEALRLRIREDLYVIPGGKQS